MLQRDQYGCFCTYGCAFIPIEHIFTISRSHLPPPPLPSPPLLACLQHLSCMLFLLHPSSLLSIPIFLRQSPLIPSFLPSFTPTIFFLNFAFLFLFSPSPYIHSSPAFTQPFFLPFHLSHAIRSPHMLSIHFPHPLLPSFSPSHNAFSLTRLSPFPLPIYTFFPAPYTSHDLTFFIFLLPSPFQPPYPPPTHSLAPYSFFSSSPLRSPLHLYV